MFNLYKQVLKKLLTDLCAYGIILLETHKEEFEMSDINKELNYCIGLLDGIYDVPKITSVKVSSRMTRTYGRCTTWRSKDDIERWKI